MTEEIQRITWSCLPKEFKEEVKKMYRKYIECRNEYDSNRRKGRANVMAKIICMNTIFGTHNLTSDAEGEEMLCVPRKKVQEFYAKCKEATKNPYSYPDYSHESALSRMALLDILFGSKCLPDEEPQPAEPKFRAGDRVRISCAYDNGEIWDKVMHGRIVTVKSVYRNAENKEILMYQFKEGIRDFAEHWLEPYTEPAPLESGQPVTERNDFDNIIKDGFSEHNRLHIAAMAMLGILSNIDLFKQVLETGREILDGEGISYRAVAKASFAFADVLVAESEKGGSDGKD